jgi:Fur family transcriptional regulator, zinc uptake regulator
MAHTHTHQHVHAHSRAEQIEAAEAACQRVGETLTPLRRRVFELLLDREGPAKAYDLLDEIKPEHGAAKPPTVYRALDFLVRLGLAHRIESQNAFVACDVGACARSTIFLICEQCGASVEVDSGHALDDVSEAAERAGFALKRTVLEAMGLCAACRA